MAFGAEDHVVDDADIDDLRRARERERGIDVGQRRRRVAIGVAVHQRDPRAARAEGDLEDLRDRGSGPIEAGGAEHADLGGPQAPVEGDDAERFGVAIKTRLEERSEIGGAADAVGVGALGERDPPAELDGREQLGPMARATEGGLARVSVQAERTGESGLVVGGEPAASENAQERRVGERAGAGEEEMIASHAARLSKRRTRVAVGSRRG